MKTWLLKLSFFLVLLVLSCGKNNNVEVEFSKIISTHGSTRATAYIMSNKIITADDKIFVSWLDSLSDVKMTYYDLKTKKWGETVLVGSGVDNHGGPALAMDSKGIFHIIYGAHHGKFQYRRSKKPYDISEWTAIDSVGIYSTYPSLVVDAKDRLHLTYRGGPMPRRLMYQRRDENGVWSEAIELVKAPADTGYTQYGNPIFISPDGVLHVAFHIYDVVPPAGKSVGYLRSRDGGVTWENVKGEKLSLPVTIESPCFIEKGDSLDMRVGNVIVDSDGAPYVPVMHLEKSPRTTLLWRFDGEKWVAKSLLPEIQKYFPEKEITYTTITFDRDGVFYLLCDVQNSGDTTFWGDPSLEVVLLTSCDRGESFRLIPISKPDANIPNWLPSMERPYSLKAIGLPSLIYTHGDRGTTVTDGQATEVIFVKLKKGK